MAVWVGACAPVKPIEISPHSPTRVYFASQRVWRSDDRGDSWMPISNHVAQDMLTWQAAGGFSLDKLTTVPREKLGSRIGRLDDEDTVRLNQAMLVFLGLARPARRST